MHLHSWEFLIAKYVEISTIRTRDFYTQYDHVGNPQPNPTKKYKTNILTKLMVTINLEFFHHISRRTCVDLLRNTWDACDKASVLLTSKSIRSPRSSTFSNQNELHVIYKSTNIWYHNILDLINFPLHFGKFIHGIIWRIIFLHKIKQLIKFIPWVELMF